MWSTLWLDLGSNLESLRPAEGFWVLVADELSHRDQRQGSAADRQTSGHEAELVSQHRNMIGHSSKVALAWTATADIRRCIGAGSVFPSFFVWWKLSGTVPDAEQLAAHAKQF